MKKITLIEIEAKDLKLGDIVARASGQITSIEFCAIHEIRNYADGRVHIVQKTKNGVTLNADSRVWVMIPSTSAASKALDNLNAKTPILEMPTIKKDLKHKEQYVRSQMDE